MVVEEVTISRLVCVTNLICNSTSETLLGKDRRTGITRHVTFYSLPRYRPINCFLVVAFDELSKAQNFHEQ
jgi:hypothetical protein